MVKRTGPTNPRTRELVVELRKTKKPIWKATADILEKPRRRMAEMNVSRLGRNAKKNDNVIIPGKVLGSGEIDIPVNVAALSWSDVAEKKISTAGGSIIEISEMIKSSPKGLRLMK